MTEIHHICSLDHRLAQLSDEPWIMDRQRTHSYFCITFCITSLVGGDISLNKKTVRVYRLPSDKRSLIGS